MGEKEREAVADGGLLVPSASMDRWRKFQVHSPRMVYGCGVEERRRPSLRLIGLPSRL
ncbi:MAG: hypothetical protein QW569_03985 [Candidatus Bathyarchaeia archaeon]|nr:hypothetical protein [Candidatus Bathyarchaeota archaeon]